MDAKSFALIYAAILFLSSLGCATRAEPIAMKTVAKGAFSGIAEPKQIAIRETSAWKEFWAQHAVNEKEAEKVPEVNFDTHMVLAVTMGRQRTGGYTVEITKVEAEGDKLVATIQRRVPPVNGVLIQVITSPFHFVAVPKSSLKVEFVQPK